ncbi:unnamed protein product [Clavelina lepadiformis]|uniref:Uncharacterized protein n=1 Tax=Clavelina lepadiformis TaxID=159417 RepID=A0ABP0FSE4_CLALP
MKIILPSLFLIMFFTLSTQAQSYYCGFENDDDPFCGYKNDGWDRYNNYSELAAGGSELVSWYQFYHSLVRSVKCVGITSKQNGLLRILDQVAQKVNVSDGEIFNATTPNIFVAVVNLPEANSSDKDHGFGVGLRAAFQPNTGKFFSNYSFSLYFEDKIINQTSIFVPYQIIDKSKGDLVFTEDGKVSFYSFLGDSLFNANSSMNKIKDKHGFEKSIVNSYVILSATILDPENTTENFTEKIQISFEMNESLQMPSVFGSSFCGFWVEDGSYWSSEGCTKLSSSEQLLRCECNHLTNFASLFAFGNLTDNRGIDILTYVGCSISGIASLLTIIALLITWKSVKVQMRQSTKFVMLNLSFSLFLLNILILISEIPGVRSDEGKCKAVAGTLHFALISAFLWMFAQAVPVFISIINVMNPLLLKQQFVTNNDLVKTLVCLDISN